MLCQRLINQREAGGHQGELLVDGEGKGSEIVAGRIGNPVGMQDLLIHQLECLLGTRTGRCQGFGQCLTHDRVGQRNLIKELGGFLNVQLQFDRHSFEADLILSRHLAASQQNRAARPHLTEVFGHLGKRRQHGRLQKVGRRVCFEHQTTFMADVLKQCQRIDDQRVMPGKTLRRRNLPA